MSAIFVTQGYLTITLDMGVDLTTATSPKILYKKPSGVKGEWTATVVETTKLRYQFDNDDLDISGNWSFQAFALIGGLNAFGEIVYEKVEKTLL